MNKNILFGERLKAARIQRELRQKDIADAIGISVSTYSLYETGSRTPSIHKLTQIAQVLQVSADELLDLPPKHAVSDTLLPLSPSYQKILDSLRSCIFPWSFRFDWKLQSLCCIITKN